jgi:hypothetical protein
MSLRIACGDWITLRNIINSKYKQILDVFINNIAKLNIQEKIKETDDIKITEGVMSDISKIYKKYQEHRLEEININIKCILNGKECYIIKVYPKTLEFEVHLDDKDIKFMIDDLIMDCDMLSDHEHDGGNNESDDIDDQKTPENGTYICE